MRDAPDGDRSLLLVGGQGHTTGRGGPTSDRLDALREWTLEHFPWAHETHAWSAQDYVPAHALPYAGPLLPGRDEILFAGGYSKWGLTNGVAAALALSGQILDGHMEWAEVFHPWRSRELRGLPNGARGQRGGRLRDGARLAPPAAGVARRAVRPSGRSHRAGRTAVAGCRRCAPTSAGSCGWNDAERSWDCPLHGSRFDENGEVLEGPATCGLRTALNAPGRVDGVPRLLVVHHSPTPTVRTLTDAVLAGAHDDAIEGVEVVERPALEASADDVLGADGYLLGTTANFGYMSGALKHFFDTIFLEAGGALSDDGSASASTGGKKPYGLWVHGRYDTTGAVRSVQSIVQALRGCSRRRCWRCSATWARSRPRRRTSSAARSRRC